MPFDLYVWKTPRNLDREAAAALVRDWEAGGADPSNGPFEPSTDIGWFYRELQGDRHDLELLSDARPRASNRPIWLETEDEPPARLIAIRLPPGPPDPDAELRRVISPGGGAVVDPRNRWALYRGRVPVWLDVRPEVLGQRLRRSPNVRPLVQGGDPVGEAILLGNCATGAFTQSVPPWKLRLVGA